MEITSEYLQERLLNEGAPDWIAEMQGNYHRTGLFRPRDLRRLLGDPCERVVFGGSIDEVRESFLGR